MLQAQSFQEKYYTSHDGLKLYYRDYDHSDSDKTPLLCLHGLTRNSKDFNKLARHFSWQRRVISLDIRGRGKSDYDPNYHNYQIPVYAQDVITFLKHEGIDKVIAVGTSMGGLISMAIGATMPDIFKAIILNDIGPHIEKEGIKRISGYVGNGTVMEGWQQAINSMREMLETIFPDYEAEDWELFTRNTFRQHEDGTIIADYDQAIGTAVRESSENGNSVDLWDMFKGLSHIPVLTLRGENSDILSKKTLNKMAKEHPNFTKITIANRAHTPDLNEDSSLHEIGEFINQLAE